MNDFGEGQISARFVSLSNIQYINTSVFSHGFSTVIAAQSTLS